MARAKKQKLSLEELLEQALVKEEEQPYEVPSNWVWTQLGSLLKPMITQKPNKDKEFFEYIDIEVIDNKRQLISEPKKILVKDAPSRASREISYGDTLFSLVRPYLRNIAFVEKEHEKCIASTGFYVCKPKSIVNPLYLYSLLCSEYVVNTLNQFMKGDNSPSIRGGELEMCNVPLPPIAEQQRIVERIESLFEKLDTAKELAQNALDSFENRKAAILHKAFTGELTAKWREENGVSLDSWEEKELKEICSIITDGTHQTPTYTDSGYTFLSSKNVTKGKIDWENVKYIPEELHEKLYTRLAPQINDILLAKNGTTGVAAIVDRDCVFDIYVSLALLRPTDSVIPKYLLYAVNNPITKSKFQGQLTGIGVPNLHLRNIRVTTIPVPAIQEQEVIIENLDKLLAEEQQAQELCDVIEKIDLMKKAILARAFRGELGTNNPEEESAIELLKEVLKEKL